MAILIKQYSTEKQFKMNLILLKIKIIYVKAMNWLIYFFEFIVE